MKDATKEKLLDLFAIEILKMTDPETNMSEYIAGFDAGYAYVLNEIEKWVKREAHNPQRNAPVLSLLAHLKVEESRLGKTPR